MSLLLNGRVQSMDGGDGCTTMMRYKMPLNWIPNVVKAVSFVMCTILPQVFEKGGEQTLEGVSKPSQWQTLSP